MPGGTTDRLRPAGSMRGLPDPKARKSPENKRFPGLRAFGAYRRRIKAAS